MIILICGGERGREGEEIKLIWGTEDETAWGGEDEQRERKGMGGVQMKTMHSCMDGWREEGLGGQELGCGVRLTFECNG